MSRQEELQKATNRHTHTHTHTLALTHSLSYTHMHIHTQRQTPRAQTHTHTQRHRQTHTHTHTYTHTHTHIHTHTHTPANTFWAVTGIVRDTLRGAWEKKKHTSAPCCLYAWQNPGRTVARLLPLALENPSEEADIPTFATLFRLGWGREA